MSSQKKYNYTVALQTNEVHSHRDRLVTIPVQGLDVVQQVSKELVAPLKHTQGHDVVPPHVLHDLPGQPLCPVRGGLPRERGGGG